MITETPNRCETYYLFTEVNSNFIPWDTLGKYRYYHFIRLLVEFMPAKILFSNF